MTSCPAGRCLRPLDDLPHGAAGVVALAPFASSQVTPWVPQ